MSPRDPLFSLPPQGWGHNLVLPCLSPLGMDLGDPSQDPVLTRQVLPIEVSNQKSPYWQAGKGTNGIHRGR